MEKTAHTPYIPKERARFEPKHYRLSDAVRDALADAAKPYCAMNFDALDKDTSKDMAEDFVVCLSTDQSGRDALDAMQQLQDQTGASALVLENLPTDDERVMEAVMLMYQRSVFGAENMHKSDIHTGVDKKVKDTPINNPDKPIEAQGFMTPHADPADTAALFCVRPGKLQRPTALYTVSDWIDLLVRELASPEDSPETYWKLREQAIHTLSQPLWNADVAQQSGLDNLERHGHTNSRFPHQVPLLYANPYYDPSVEGSEPYSLLNLGFSSLPELLPEYQGNNLATNLNAQWIASKMMGRDARTNVYLNAGEMLIFNNHNMLHAGVAYKDAKAALGDETLGIDDCRYILAVDGLKPTVREATFPEKPARWAETVKGGTAEKEEVVGWKR